MIRVLTASYYIGMIILLAGILLALTEKPYAVYLYGIGLLPVLGIRVFNFIVAKPENKRKNLIMVVSGIMLAIAGVAIYMGKSWWIVFIAISAILDFYISFRKFS